MYIVRKFRTLRVPLYNVQIDWSISTRSPKVYGNAGPFAIEATADLRKSMAVQVRNERDRSGSDTPAARLIDVSSGRTTLNVEIAVRGEATLGMTSHLAGLKRRGTGSAGSYALSSRSLSLSSPSWSHLLCNVDWRAFVAALSSHHRNSQCCLLALTVHSPLTVLLATKRHTSKPLEKSQSLQRLECRACSGATIYTATLTWLDRSATSLPRPMCS